MTAAAVVAVAGLVPIVVAIHAAGARRLALDQRRATVRALRQLTAAIEHHECDAVAHRLTEVLHLRGCRYEDDDPHDGLPAILPDGSLDTLVQRRDGTGIVLPERLAIPSGRGRFVLHGDPSCGTTVEQRLVAVAMARLVDTLRSSSRA